LRNESDLSAETSQQVSDPPCKISILVNGEVVQENSTKPHELPIEKEVNLCAGLLIGCSDETKE